MSEFAQHVFQGVTPDKYAVLVEKARKAGIELSGNSGTSSKFGVEITWNYSPEAQELTLQCLKAPFFMKKAALDAKIETLARETWRDSATGDRMGAIPLKSKWWQSVLILLRPIARPIPGKANHVSGKLRPHYACGTSPAWTRPR